MARERDEGKRQAILAEAKRLFAERGFDGTSVPEIVRALGFPVGTVYTYFSGKDDIARCAIEEGWSGFFDELRAACDAEPDATRRLYLLVDRFLPMLFSDVDLITIFLSEGRRFTNLGEKLSTISGYIGGILAEAASERGVRLDLDEPSMQAALAIYFLGSLDAVRLSRKAGLRMSERDVVAFIRLSIENLFGPRPA